MASSSSEIAGEGEAVAKLLVRDGVAAGVELRFTKGEDGSRREGGEVLALGHSSTAKHV